MDVVKGEIGPEAKYNLELKDGGVLLTLEYSGADTSAKLEVKLGVDQFLKKIEDMIPGEIDNAIIDGLRAALK